MNTQRLFSEPRAFWLLTSEKCGFKAFHDKRPVEVMNAAWISHVKSVHPQPKVLTGDK
jgi:hypothetical protein